MRKHNCEKVIPRPLTEVFQTFKTGKQTGARDSDARYCENIVLFL